MITPATRWKSASTSTICWTRWRLSGLYASGDGDPQNNTQGGFDAIFENPQFAGGDTSYWIRQQIPLIGAGGGANMGSEPHAHRTVLHATAWKARPRIPNLADEFEPVFMPLK